MDNTSFSLSPHIKCKTLPADFSGSHYSNKYLSPAVRGLTVQHGKCNFSSTGGSKAFDITVFDFLKVSAEEYAQQITLLDLECFQCIQENELLSRSWNNSKEKNKTSPNIVAFTRRFNHVNFWVQRTILDQSSPKLRADYISHFIKIAKKLNELNNLHAEYAAILGLRSLPLERLRKSWELVPKKDKSTLEKLHQLFDSDNNYQTLREHVQTTQLPCIPHIGIYLRDLIYIDTVSPKSGSARGLVRCQQEAVILETIRNLQNSSYDGLLPQEHTQTYLNSVRYIEELQKFLEDELYKTSLHLEPEPTTPGTSKSHHFHRPSPSKDDLSLLAKGTRHDHGTPITCTVSCDQRGVETLAAPKQTFVPTHRKAKSLGSNVFKLTKPEDVGRLGGAPVQLVGFSPLTADHSGFSVASASSTVAAGDRCLIDDSLATPSPRHSPSSSHTGSLSQLSLTDKAGSVTGQDEAVDELMQPSSDPLDESTEQLRVDFQNDVHISMEGSVKRRSVLKHGKKPAISHWHRYWVALAENCLYYYPVKSFHVKATSRDQFSDHCAKRECIDGWFAFMSDSQQHSNVFLLTDPKTGCKYKFQCQSHIVALEWFRKLNEAAKLTESQDLITLF